MNRRRYVGAFGRLLPNTPARNTPARNTVALAVAFAVIFAPACARAADLSKDIRTAPDATEFTSAIHQYVQEKLGIISKDDDAKATSQARDSLVDEVRGLVPPSPSFLDIYVNELQTLVPSITKNPSVRVRLNVAIVIAKIAAASQDPRLAKLITIELSDPNEAVVLWGLKAAHDVLPPTLGVATIKSQLVTAITTAAKRLNTGDTAGAAYYALATDASLVAPIQDLLAWRVQQYGNGIPPEPPADGGATDYLTQLAVWRSQSKAQQTTTLQLIVNLIGDAAGAFAGAQPPDRDELARLLASAGEAIEVIGLNTTNPTLSLAVKPLEGANGHMPPEGITAAATSAINAVSLNFRTVKAPKGFAAPATTPAATPASAASAAP